jgi:hypothetical protein
VGLTTGTPPLNILAMSTSLRWLPLVVALLLAGLPARAEEKNGLHVTVGKTTLDRADQRRGYYYSTRINRIEALKVSIRNTTFKALPAGEVKWEMLNRKYYSTTIESMSGTEKLQPLKAAEKVDMVIGGAQVQGWRDTSNQAKDKIEWQIVILQEGKELMRMSSTSAFDTLAKRATKIDPPKQDDEKK